MPQPHDCEVAGNSDRGSLIFRFDVYNPATMTADLPKKPSLPITDGPVPVFDCHVLLKQTDSGVVARTANIDGISVTGPTERDALLAIVKVFKKTVAELHSNNQPIPFRSEPLSPEDGEVERWVPVHL